MSKGRMFLPGNEAQMNDASSRLISFAPCEPFCGPNQSVR
jgi:hypothetical protein